MISRNYHQMNSMQSCSLESQRKKREAENRFDDQFILDQIYTNKLKTSESMIINTQKKFKDIMDCIDYDMNDFRVDSLTGLVEMKQKIHKDFYLQQIKKKKKMKKEFSQYEKQSIEGTFSKQKHKKNQSCNEASYLSKTQDKSHIFIIDKTNPNNLADKSISKNKDKNNNTV